MIRCALAALLLLFGFVDAADAADRGQWPGLGEKARRWFNAQKSSKGFCCSMADGYPAVWRIRDTRYEVQIDKDGEWLPVPPESVIIDPDNPTGQAVVWYTMVRWGDQNKYDIRCFVPGPES